MTRLHFLSAAVLLFASSLDALAQAPIDRHALVTRHNPTLHQLEVDCPLTVGNGDFAFGCDITGLQTFAEQYQHWGVPAEILSRWCWVTDPNPNHYTLADASKNFTLPDGRVLPFPTKQNSPAGDWLRKNPRIQPLGQLSLEWDKPNGSAIAPEDIQEPEQTLDLWTGIATSRFKLGGVPVKVTTACHPERDIVAVRIESALVAQGKLRARLAFPRGHDLKVKNTPGYDWSHPETHTSKLVTLSRIERTVGLTRYDVTVDFTWAPRVHASSEMAGRLQEESAHQFRLKGDAGWNELGFTICFAAPVTPMAAAPAPANKTTLPDAVFAASAAHWEKFWREGAAVDFSGSTNPLAPKLEERIVLSRYLLAVQMAGDVPPQESGLTCATWYGKHHTEMIWWHAAHFALWGHDDLLAKNLAWYQSQLPVARALAQSRGLKGARWAKMTGPEMRESPGGNPLIAWNQPHPVYLCELLYRNAPTPATLARYRDLVLETADCLASMLYFDEARGEYVLGPPLWISQEIYDQATSRNPSFELAYWRFALETAQRWRERLGLGRSADWDRILSHLAPLPVKDGRYVALESQPDTFDNVASRHDHPTMLAPLGLLPGGGVDRATMQRTLDAVLRSWDWETKIWGWDYPMIAMTAARLGRADVAVEVLLRDGPNNRYLPNGHCPQRSDEAARPGSPQATARSQAPGARKREIAVYLPANGALLSAVALMVAGWDGCTETQPGFPKDGTWAIRAEGLHPLP